MSEPAYQPESPPSRPPVDAGQHIPGRMESVLLHFGTVGELLLMVARGDRWWMLPLVSVFLLVGLVLVFLQSVQYVAPFIYVVF